MCCFNCKRQEAGSFSPICRIRLSQGQIYVLGSIESVLEKAGNDVIKILTSEDIENTVHGSRM